MKIDLDPLRESLIAARLLREEVLLAPVPPGDRALQRTAILGENGAPPADGRALSEAARLVEEASGPAVGREALDAIAAACGSAGPRRGPGEPFQGRPAPAPREVSGLFDELLETIDAPLAIEGWPPPIRAFALHFLLRLVQPYDAPPVAVAFAAEAFLLSTDGFAADRMLLPSPDVGAAGRRPDPDAFVRARTEELAGRVGESLGRLRGASARGVLLAWLETRGTGLGTRQKHLLRHLAAEGGTRRLTFAEYVSLHAGRGAPSLRSLQRDWQGLRDRGLLAAEGERHRLDTAPFAFGA